MLRTSTVEQVRPAPDAGGPASRTGTAWVRFTAVGGLAFFGLIIAFGSLTSNSPSTNDTRQEIFRYLAQHHDRLQLAAALYGMAMPAALLVLAGLFAVLRNAEGGRARLAVATLAGGVLTAAATVTGALVLGVTATRFQDLGPAGARVFWTMFRLSFGATLLGQLLLTGSAGLISLRTRILPRWFAVASVLLAAASGVGGFTIGYTADGIQAVAGLAVLLDVVWILLASTYLWRRPELAGT